MSIIVLTYCEKYASLYLVLTLLEKSIFDRTFVKKGSFSWDWTVKGKSWFGVFKANLGVRKSSDSIINIVQPLKRKSVESAPQKP